jgi:NAD(P)-dependent dehydrogenase (short-subunit alcohol dehydrogenase family)
MRCATGNETEAWVLAVGAQVGGVSQIMERGFDRRNADLVAFLVSAPAAFITGTAINLDGGMGATV